MSIWQNFLRYLMNRGFPGPLASRLRFHGWADGKVTVERYYRFRWQNLCTRGPDLPMPDRFYWSRHGVIARFPDTGQMNDAIGIANRDAAQKIAGKKKMWTETIDAEAPDKAKAPAKLDDAPEDIAS